MHQELPLDIDKKYVDAFAFVREYNAHDSEQVYQKLIESFTQSLAKAAKNNRLCLSIFRAVDESCKDKNEVLNILLEIAKQTLIDRNFAFDIILTGFLRENQHLFEAFHASLCKYLRKICIEHSDESKLSLQFQNLHPEACSFLASEIFLTGEVSFGKKFLLKGFFMHIFFRPNIYRLFTNALERALSKDKSIRPVLFRGFISLCQQFI